MRYLPVLTILLVLFTTAVSAQNYTGANQCRIRILTDAHDYEFTSGKVEARLNEALERFEFIIPVKTLQVVNPVGDTTFLSNVVNDNPHILINASLPQERIDFAPFKSNAVITMPAEILIGPYTFNSRIQFKGMLANDNNTIIFDLRAFFNNGNKPLINTGRENIIEIEVAALGDKITGLTSN